MTTARGLRSTLGAVPAPLLHRLRALWPSVALLAPLLLLAALGVRGIQANRAAARERAAAEVERALERVGAEWTQFLEKLRPAALVPQLYPEIPVPVEASAFYERYLAALELTGAERSTALEALASEAAEALTPSGLPLPALIAWAQWQAEPEPAAWPERWARLRQVILIKAPSILTPQLLREAAELAKTRGLAEDLAAWQAEWEHGGRLRTVARRHATLLAQPFAPQWLATEGERWWAERSAEGALALYPAGALRGFTGSGLPPYAGLELSLGGEALGPASGGEVLAQRREGALRLTGRLQAPAALYAVERRETAWLAALLGCALVAELVAVWALQRALRRAARLSELKSAFVASVSHELRTPVASIRLMAENLEAGTVREPERCRAYHRLMAEECRRLSVLIDNVLDLARIEQQRRSYHFAETDVAALAADAVEFLRPRAAERQQELHATLAPRERICDGLAVRQALLNLLDNALKFSAPGTPVRVTLQAPAPGWWSLAVHDEGPGIPPSEHLRIFERFYRLGTELRRETTGTGIGLSIVQHIVHGHGGRVEVTSAPGRGATFTLLFPDLLPSSTPAEVAYE